MGKNRDGTVDFSFSVKDIELETERLLIRPWKRGDIQDFHAYASVPGVGEMAGWHHHRSLAETDRILNHFIEGEEVLALVSKADRKVIGSLGIHRVPHNLPDPLQGLPAKEVGYALSKDYWGGGLMLEAVRALIPYLFHYTEARLLVCCCTEANRQSRRVMEKAGFRFSRRFQRRRDIPDSQPTLEYHLLKEAFDAMSRPKINFENDYTTGCHPLVLDELVRTNDQAVSGYGRDPFTEEARALIREACGTSEAQVHFCTGGTQANLVLVAGALKPWQGVISAGTGHINVHEAGAIEATGHKVLVIPSQDGLLTASSIDQYCRSLAEDATREHMVQPGLVYLSQPTELGTVYRRSDLEAIRRTADHWGLRVFIDGARLASALALPELDLDLADLAGLAQAFTIGGTKCGAMFGEAIVVTDQELQKDFRTLLKQRGGLLAKGRLLGVQFAALFRQDLYLEIGRHQNALASQLADAFRARGVAFYAPPRTNQLFVILGGELLEALEERALFETVLPLDSGRQVCRFVTSCATRVEDIESLFE